MFLNRNNITYLFTSLPLLSICACSVLQSKTDKRSLCEKESVKKLKKIKKHLSATQDGVYNYLYDQVSVPHGFETIFWERKIGRDYAVSIQITDTLSMQFLQLPLSLQEIIYGECDGKVNKDDLLSHFGPPTYISKSMLPHAKHSYVYSFNKPDQIKCYHEEYMGNVAYQDCLSIILELDNMGRVVELNSSSFVVSPISDFR